MTKLSPDHRPHWSDPDLPVYGKSGQPIDPKKMVQKAKMDLVMSPEPTYQYDPTYNLRKKKP